MFTKRFGLDITDSIVKESDEFCKESFTWSCVFNSSLLHMLEIKNVKFHVITPLGHTLLIAETSKFNKRSIEQLKIFGFVEHN